VPLVQHAIIQCRRVAGENDPARQGLEQVKQVHRVLPAVLIAVAAGRGPCRKQVGRVAIEQCCPGVVLCAQVAVGARVDCLHGIPAGEGLQGVRVEVNGDSVPGGCLLPHHGPATQMGFDRGVVGRHQFWYNPEAAVEPKYPVMPLPWCVSWEPSIDEGASGVTLIQHYPCHTFYA